MLALLTVLTLTGICVYRTFVVFKVTPVEGECKQSDSHQPITDVDNLIARFSRAIQFRTVTAGPKQVDEVELLRFINWLETGSSQFRPINQSTAFQQQTSVFTPKQLIRHSTSPNSSSMSVWPTFRFFTRSRVAIATSNRTCCAVIWTSCRSNWTSGLSNRLPALSKMNTFTEEERSTSRTL